VKLFKDTVLAFIDDEALSRGAAIAFYAVTSIAPVLLIVIAIAGLAFGHDAAENAVKGQLSALMGEQTADVVQTAVANASSKSSGILATLIGIATLIATASGVFGEMQSALNAIWKVQPSGTTLSRLVRARAASLGLVATLGFLLMVSLVVSAGLTAFGNYLNSLFPFGAFVLSILKVAVSLLLVSLLFAAIYKVLPDRHLQWRDVILGAVVTAVLFTIGKALIGWYIGGSAVASSYGAAGALIVLLHFLAGGRIHQGLYRRLFQNGRWASERLWMTARRLERGRLPTSEGMELPTEEVFPLRRQQAFHFVRRRRRSRQSRTPAPIHSP
jgi:membrane protein